MVPYKNKLQNTKRDKGAHIIHFPSEVIDYYKDSPARKRMMKAPRISLPRNQKHIDPPLPIDDSDNRSGTGEIEPCQVWNRQPETIDIEQYHDVISDNEK